MERLVLSAVLVMVSLLLALLAVGFAAAALYLALATLMSPPLAALACAGALLLAALLIVLLANLRRPAAQPRSAPPPGSDLNQIAAALGSRLGQQAALQAQSHPWAAAGAALACGAIVGASPRLRALLRGVLVD